MKRSASEPGLTVPTGTCVARSVSANLCVNVNNLIIKFSRVHNNSISNSNVFYPCNSVFNCNGD